MSSQALLDVWNAAASSPYEPTIAKSSQLAVGIVSLFLSILLAGAFSLNPSFKNVPIIGIPASALFAVGAVYMICGSGVYV